MRIGVAGVLILLPMSLSALGVNDYDREQIQERIRPVGQVRVQQSSSQSTNATAGEPEKKEASEKRTGESIYEQYCITCHKDGLLGAPKFRDETDWKPRLMKQNIESLTATALKGLNAMPAKGTCQDCSDADMKAAIEYMVPK